MFPDIRSARDWYVSARDGLRSLEHFVHAPIRHANISQMTDDAIFGMTEAEWKEYLQRRLEEHELFASLALMASCEGAIRRDLQWRIAQQRSHHHHFSKVPEKGHIKTSIILGRWLRALGATSFAGSRLKKLLDLYVGRNALAHGVAPIGSVVFETLWEELRKIEEKWKQAVPDFQGF